MQRGCPEEEEQAVQVFQALAEGGAGDAPAVAGRQAGGHQGCFGSGGFHHLCLIQAHTPPMQAGQGGWNDLKIHSRLIT